MKKSHVKTDVAQFCFTSGMDWMDLLGGVKYKASYGANDLCLEEDANTSVCPIMLVHEAEDMKNLMNGNDQPVSETAGVQINNLLPTLHPKLASTLRARDKHHIVGTRAVGWKKGDARSPLCDVLHRIFHNLTVGAERK